MKVIVVTENLSVETRKATDYPQKGRRNAKQNSKSPWRTNIAKNLDRDTDNPASLRVHAEGCLSCRT